MWGHAAYGVLMSEQRVTTFPWPANLPESAGSGRRALVLPGSGYSADRPLLYWAAQVLALHGWHVQAVRWHIDDAARTQPREFVESAADLALAACPPGGPALVLAKSFGTFAAQWSAHRGFPGIWLTPLLSTPEVARALVESGQPGLLVGGTADQLWDGDQARRSRHEVMEVPGADHVLELRTDWRASLAVLQEVLERIERFAATLSAPAASTA